MLSYEEQAKLIWGSTWDWYKKPLPSLSVHEATKYCDQAFMRDKALFSAFIAFFSRDKSTWAEDLIEQRDEVPVPDLNNPSEARAIWEELILYVDVGQLLASERAAWECHFFDYLSGRRLANRLHKEGERDYIIECESFPTLYSFDLCDHLRTVRSFMAPTISEIHACDVKKDIKTIVDIVMEESDAPRIWRIKPDNTNQDPVLIVDPRIPLDDVAEYGSAKKEVEDSLDREVIVYAGELPQKLINDDIIRRDDIKFWVKVRDEYLKFNTPSLPSLPQEYINAKQLIEESRGQIRNCNFRSAIVTAARAVYWLCMHEFGEEGQNLADVLHVKREEITGWFGERGRRIWSEMMDLKNIRNKAEHDKAYQPTHHDANEAVSLACIIVNNFIRVEQKRK